MIYFARSHRHIDNEIPPYEFNESVTQDASHTHKYEHIKKLENMRIFVELLLNRYNFLKSEYVEKRLQLVENVKSMEIFIHDVLCEFDSYVGENKKIITKKGNLKIIRISIAAKEFSEIGNQKTLEGWFKNVNDTYIKNLGILKP